MILITFDIKPHQFDKTLRKNARIRTQDFENFTTDSDYAIPTY